MKLFTWLDVRKIFRKKTRNGYTLPDGVVRINCFSDAVEIGITTPEIENVIKENLKEWFGNWYEANNNVIKLDVGDVDLPVEITTEDALNFSKDNIFRPFWEEITYASKINNNESQEYEQEEEPLINLPKPYNNTDKIPQIISFYSFKGGVGRSLHLSAYVLALVEEAKKTNKPLKILIIDSDLEAPGITYWQRLQHKASISFLDFLEIYHSSSTDKEESMNFIVQKIKTQVRQDGISEIYTLPACVEDEELLDVSILPEHLVKSPAGIWEFSESLYKLGSFMNIDYIFIDLRSGLSEISSPILFDPRIQRFLVTTMNEQSVSGTSLVLKQLSNVAPLEKQIKENTYHDPTVLLSFLTPDIQSLPKYEDVLTELQSSYVISQEKMDFESRLEIQETDFSQNLLYIKDWEDAKSKLADTIVMKIAREWAINQLVISDVSNSKVPFTDLSYEQKLDIVKKLKDVCGKYIYAESGESDDLLVTESLKNLAVNFQNDLPRVVSIGAKGSGKTFNYIQLSRFKYWHNFLQKVLPNSFETSIANRIVMYPLLQSSFIKKKGLNILNESRNEIKQQLQDDNINFSNQDCKDRIEKALQNENWTKVDWTRFWLKEIADCIGFKIQNPEEYHVSKIDQFLKEKSCKIIFLFDGIEDIFQNILTNDSQKIAIQSLISIPQRLEEVRNSHLGVIIFIRRDFVIHVVGQNLGQFESLYSEFDVFWDGDSFLRLVHWVFLQAKIPNITQNSDINILEKQDLIDELNKVWGQKLGLKTASESFTTEWIFAALSDFKGRLQARDIVRFLYYVANKTLEKPDEVEFEKWFNFVSDNNIRLLPPKSIRCSIEPCSKEKIEEIKEEYPDFKEWFENLPITDTNVMRIPFNTDQLEQLNIDKKTLTMLEEIGVIYEDKDKNNNIHYYIPEIFRGGLNFILDKGARPRVVTLKRKTLGKFFF